MTARPRLQLTYLWHQQALGYRLLVPGAPATIGAAKGTTFVTPRLQGFPRRFRLLTPVKDGYRLRLGPGMSGQLSLRGERRSVGDVLAQPAARRFLRDPGMFREIELYPGDTALVNLDPDGALRLQISFTDAPEVVGRPPGGRETLLFKTGFGTAVGTMVLLAAIMIIGGQIKEDMNISPERYAKVVAPVAEAPKVQEAREKQKKAVAERERKRKEKEDAESKKIREKEGRIGRNDAKQKETIIPKGRQDILREKVAKTGLLAALGNARAPGSGIGKLFDPTNSTEMEQAVNGVTGANLVAGRGNSGLGVAGVGIGGGGTGYGGKVLGSGSLDVGAGRGRGKTPGLGKGKEREVQAGVETGSPDAEGGLTREQINRVVRAHKAALEYCYTKELQRSPTLAGRVDLFWVIRTNGSVDRTKIADTTLGNRAVEGCLERQIKNWQFPRSDAETIVQKYPFFFKGGG
jgi:hypothetical protein